MRIPIGPRRRELLLHQRSCLDWIAQGNINHPALFMEMRLGKTLTLVRAVVEVWQSKGPCLVVAPVTVLESWEKELDLEQEAYLVCHGMKKNERLEAVAEAFKSKGRMWILMSYGTLRETPEVADLLWEVVALDESTCVKNPKAQISKLCAAGFRTVRHRSILTGLPSPESELDLFQQFKFLHGAFIGHSSYYGFRASYGVKTGRFGGWEVATENLETIKTYVHRTAFVMRRQDAGLSGTKIYETRTIKMDRQQEEAYRQVEDEFSTWVDRGDHEELIETDLAIVRETWVARIAGGCDVEGTMQWPGKINEIIHLLKGELKNQPVVIWFRFNGELKACAEALTEKGIPVGTLTGESDREKRKRTLQWFRSSREPSRVLLCQVMLAKYGIDVSVSDTAIYYSMPYSCEAFAQSEDRIYHPQKQSPLLYVYLVTEDTVDEDVAFAVSQKVTTAKLFMQRFRESFLNRRKNRVPNR